RETRGVAGSPPRSAPPATAASAGGRTTDGQNVPVPSAPVRRARWRGPSIWVLAVVAVVVGLDGSLLPGLLPTAAEKASAAAALAGGNAWGDARTVEDYRAFTTSLMRRYHLTRVYLMAESMGGLAGMQLGDRLPRAQALVGIYPVCDLRTMVRHRTFTAAI